MADLVDTVRKQINARLDELRPIVEEAAGLEAALNALQGMDGAATRRAQPRAHRAATSRNGRGRPRGQSREQLIEYVRAHPGSTAGDVASALGLKRTSVSTRLAQLAKAGELTKAERGYAAP